MTVSYCLVRTLVPGLILLLPAARTSAQSDSLYYESRPAMGTEFEIYLYGSDARRAGELFETGFAEIERVEALLSTYRPESELSRLNARASAGPVTTDPELYALLERAISSSRRTEGAFDLTVGGLVDAWGFFRGQGRYPAPEALAEARSGTGWQNVRLDPAERTVQFLAPGLRLDPGAVGKGYALDRVAEVLRSHGVVAALIGAGTSSWYALGAPPDRPGWRVRVAHPVDSAATLSTALLRDESLSTSGSYHKFFELDGRRYCHILDPRSGRPVEGRLQVTVIAPQATDSDALSTALFVLGPQAAPAVLAGLRGASALFVEGEADVARVVRVRWPGSVRAEATNTLDVGSETTRERNQWIDDDSSVWQAPGSRGWR